MSVAPSSTGGRAARVRASGDAGINLTELTIAMGVGSLLLLLVTGVYTSSLRTTSTVTAKVSATADVAHATDVIARRLRVAAAPTATTPAVVDMQAGRLSFYASITTDPTATVDPVPTLVTYVYDAGRGCLTETLTPGTGPAPYTWPVTGARTTCLVRGDVTGGDSALFRYFTTAGGSTVALTPATVRAVQVSLAVAQTSGTGAAVTRDGVRAPLDNLGA